MSEDKTNAWVETWLGEPVRQDLFEAMGRAMVYPYPPEARALIVQYPPGTVVACSCNRPGCPGDPVVVIDVVQGPHGSPVLVAIKGPESQEKVAVCPNPNTKTLGYKPGLSPLTARALLGPRGVA